MVEVAGFGDKADVAVVVVLVDEEVGVMAIFGLVNVVAVLAVFRVADVITGAIFAV